MCLLVWISVCVWECSREGIPCSRVRLLELHCSRLQLNCLFMSVGQRGETVAMFHHDMKEPALL